MTSAISYYGFPIKTIQHDNYNKTYFIEYVLWGDGIRLLSVNQTPHDRLSNYEFEYFFMVVSDSLKAEVAA
jgi:hypothetical protein